MPFARKVRYSFFGALLLLLVIIYITAGPASTRNSEFYKKTVALMEYRRGGSDGAEEQQEKRLPDRPIHRAGGLHYAEGDKHLTPEERLAMEKGKLKGEPLVGPDGEAIMGPVPQSNQQGQRPIIDTDAKLKERLKEAENAAKKNADEKYRALKDIEEEVQKERELRGADPQAPIGVKSEKKKTGTAAKKEDKAKAKEHDSDDDHNPDEVHAEPPSKQDKTIAGRKKVPVDDSSAPSKPKSETKNKQPQKPLHNHDEDDEDDEDDAKEQTRLRSLLAELYAKSPVTIFSKTYCPFSKKAKHILLDAITISPPPHVVELNEHPDGPALQSLLERTTGRKTVPNVIVNGKSIGGGDETERLWRNGELPARVQQMAGKRVDSVKVNFEYGKEGDG